LQNHLDDKKMKLIYKNQKIKIFSLLLMLVGMISLGFFVQSCSNEVDDYSTNANVETRWDANAIATKYLELVDNQYVLNLSEGKAVSLGIDKANYDRMQEEIRQTNAFIIECQAKGAQIYVNDPQKIQVSSSIIRLKSDSEIAGSFDMPETGAGGSCTFYVPAGYTSITISGATPCLVGNINGTVQCGGQSIPYSATGLSGGSTTVNIPMSATYVKVTGNTPCSGGGTVVVTINSGTKK